MEATMETTPHPIESASEEPRIPQPETLAEGVDLDDLKFFRPAPVYLN
jgi:hypothetical protein